MAKKVVEIKGLEYAYPDGIRALKGISLDIFEGESVALMGLNGAGKSTLLLHLNGILQSDIGTVEVLGMKVDGNLREIRSKVGMVFQDPDDQLFMPTVFDDVAFGPINMGFSEEKVKEKVRMALELVNMSGCGARAPHHMSFGEKKRIAIATVLSMEPEILVLDEPTSNVDPNARRHLIELLNELDITKIMATHDIEMVSDTCDRAIVMFEGKIAANGAVEEVLTNSELLESHGLEAPILVKLFRDVMHRENIPLRLNDVIEKPNKYKI
ncbi:MAG: ATP-binding cassette domain-containing protein [Methanocellales archaeon]|nr:ATP-binding cassette domain-containing protein [Methanocellales archaeon]MDD3420994.1 ATP-binding cassette domain-containing protein [Methanocellales archaeon]MDD4898113.1 ATP-binding cassette domain-containing protein [Methanocellales archaeon]MDD5447275.1 ATP-binding cassette domain-containing protein [Methanocellales archaeon]